MARNKYPEKTIETILNVSSELFRKKGYNKTSIQDIINELGMSKGAIYHHFKSKDEILEQVFERSAKYNIEVFDRLIKNTKAENSREKIVQILDKILDNQSIQSSNSVMRGEIKNPQFILNGIEHSIMRDAPKIAKVFKEGTIDNSINTDYPLECAEIFMMLLNIWINPIIFKRSRSETEGRLNFLKKLMESLGADIITEKHIKKIVAIYFEAGGND